jgi:hypothetical protein
MFVLPLLTSILLVTPRQPIYVLGIEFIALGILHGTALAVSGRRKKSDAGQGEQSRLVRLLDYTSPNTVTTLIVLAAGTMLLTGHAVVVYLLVPAVILALIGGVANAWIFLIDDPD